MQANVGTVNNVGQGNTGIVGQVRCAAAACRLNLGATQACPLTLPVCRTSPRLSPPMQRRASHSSNVLPCVQTNSATQANVGRRLRADSGLDLSQLNANVANQANVAAVNNIGKDNTGIVAQVG